MFGANSQIASDLVYLLSSNPDYYFYLFSRNKFSGKEKKINVEFERYENFFSHNYDLVLNFIGAGDPLKAKSFNENFFLEVQEYDNLIIKYLNKYTDTKYVYFSSGAVYGSDFSSPVCKDTDSIVKISKNTNLNWYSLSKVFHEIQHRSHANLNIVDLRIFSYFSSTSSASAGFLMSEIMTNLKNKTVFLTDEKNIYRDYLRPKNIQMIVELILNYKLKLNCSLDLYTLQPTSKFILLNELKSQFGLKFNIIPSGNPNNESSKLFYYSLNYTAEMIGYKPDLNSLENILEGLEKVLVQYEE